MWQNTLLDTTTGHHMSCLLSVMLLYNCGGCELWLITVVVLLFASYIWKSTDNRVELSREMCKISSDRMLWDLYFTCPLYKCTWRYFNCTSKTGFILYDLPPKFAVVTTLRLLEPGTKSSMGPVPVFYC